MAVTVVVTDERGMPVAGLTRDDFKIDKNGARRPITTFRAVALPPEASLGSLPDPGCGWWGTGGGGAVLDLEIPDYTDEPLMMSGLMLTSAGSQLLPTMMAVADRKKVKSRTCRENACVAPEVRDVPIESWSPTALAVSHPLRDVFAEVYDNRRTRVIDVRVLLEAPVRPPVLVGSETLSKAAPPRASGGHGVT